MKESQAARIREVVREWFGDAAHAGRDAEELFRRIIEALKPQSTTEWMRRKREERMAAGLCVCCGQPRDRDGSRCVACSRAQTQRNIRRFAALAEAGNCRCGREADNGYKSCWKCRQKDKGRFAARAAERKQHGLCTKCESPAAAGFTMCERHLERLRDRMRQRRLIAAEIAMSGEDE